jgi:hypothetical protein
MTYWTRFWIGGGGALLPLLVTLLAVDIGPLIDNAPHLTIGTYVGAAIRYLVLFTIGGIVAALNSDEVQPIKLVQLGIAAPALISTYVNAQPPKPLSVQTAATHSRMFSLDVISSARAADAGARGDGRVLMAGFFSDVLRGATSPLSRVTPPTSPVPDKAAVDRAIENARTSAASSAAAAEKAATDASKLDHQSTPEAISSVQKSAEDARIAAQKAQSDLKTLGDVSQTGAAR